MRGVCHEETLPGHRPGRGTSLAQRLPDRAGGSQRKLEAVGENGFARTGTQRVEGQLVQGAIGHDHESRDALGKLREGLFEKVLPEPRRSARLGGVALDDEAEPQSHRVFELLARRNGMSAQSRGRQQKRPALELGVRGAHEAQQGLVGPQGVLDLAPRGQLTSATKLSRTSPRAQQPGFFLEAQRLPGPRLLVVLAPLAAQDAQLQPGDRAQGLVEPGRVFVVEPRERPKTLEV